MAFQLSPGVEFSEIDLTTIIPGVGTTEGAFAGDFAWGPADTIVTISNEIELVNTFWKPTANNFRSFFSAANFLSYARNLKVVRAIDGSKAKNASNGSVTLLIKNQAEYELTYLDQSAANAAGMFAARYPGVLGNSLKISMWTGANNNSWSTWPYKENFNSEPGSSVWASGVGGANDELHLIVVDSNGKFTGVSNTILEVFPYVSKAYDAKNDDGTSNYYVNTINEKSKYIYVINPAQRANDQVSDTTTWGNTGTSTTFAEGSSEYTVTLSGGVDGWANTGNLTLAYDKFANAEEVDVSLIITGASPQVVCESALENIAGARRDCVAFVSPEQDDVVNNAGDEVTDILTHRNTFNSTSYGVMDCNWKYQFDKYNNLYRWIPCNPDVAGLCVRTDFERDPWYSPAGFNRGHIKNVVKLAWNPTKANRDDLYKNGVNPIVSFPGEGVVLYGDKTMLTKPSAFDRINVRRLFIVLEKAITRAARYSLFEFNDEFTRAQFVALVEPFLRDVQGRRGIFDFRVVCDTTNNTPEVIDRNEFIGDIYIKPARSINFIQLNFVAVRTGVAFEEIVGKF